MPALHKILLCSLLLCLPSAVFGGEKIELVVLHVNDTHGKM